MRQMLFLFILTSFFDLSAQIISEQRLIQELEDELSSNVADVLHITDLDGDGFKDIVNTDRLYTYIHWGSANGEFELDYVEFEHATAITSGDLDGDGLQDLVVAMGDVVRIYYTIWGAIDETRYQNVTGIDIADMDGDGMQELLVSSASFMGTHFLGIAGSTQHNITDDKLFNKIKASDVDGDGDMDIMAFVDWGNSKIKWYSNNGAGNYSEMTIDFDDSQFHFDNGLFVDFDQDGDIDIVYHNSHLTEGKFSWLKNNNGVFEQIFIDGAGGIQSMAINDFDGDGDMDIIGVGSNAIDLFVNDGVHNFEKLDIYGITFAFPDILLEDIDNDGKNDIVLNDSYFSQNIRSSLSWFKNTLNSPNASGQIFYDDNQNGNFDVWEPVLRDIGVLLSPDSYEYSSGSIGQFSYFLNDGNYSLRLAPSVLNNWEVTTPNDVYNFEVSSNSPNHNDLNFGLIPKVINDSLEVSISSGITRCNQETKFTVTAKNNGTTLADGVLWFYPDNQTPIDLNLNEVDTTSGNSVGWYFDLIFPGDQFSRDVLIEMPGVEINEDTLEFNASSVFNRDTFNFEYKTVFRCAYDPNDKLVSPNRPNNAVLKGEELTYTIRFQNTGNDTAFSVLITDFLSNNLNLNTFRVVGSSHNTQLQTSINDRTVSFEFKDILLPDSTTDFIGSQGYVTYKIGFFESAPEFTTADNTADIFFDQNPAITTNTTKSVLVFSMPNQIISSAHNTLNDLDLISYPNPFSKEVGIIINEKDQETYTAILFDQLGMKVRDLGRVNSNFVIQKNDLPAGIYFLTIYGESGNRILGNQKLTVY